MDDNIPENREFKPRKITGPLTEREAKIWFNTARKNQPQPSIQQAFEKPVEELPSMTVNDPTILCPFCGEEIKKIAQKCKHCGEFLQKRSLPQELLSQEPETKPRKRQKVQTIEKTSKRFKWQIVASAVLVCLGTVTFCGSAAGGGEPSSTGLLLALAGLVWFIVVRIFIWWNHE